ncbi:hypothetical protein K435DRAFT_853201 [Dendrothele bispora CBS 962.96]|uniref:Uncharacterized protein n=1 Tax=Dendrothele bispora (strain CBS 962.96) TaxID=1314807 RepID=A0A4S8MIQ4_DENBC|nr:hypothetical protein K435DRAFT_853201 [Dendrothele bispora CBS 962.96]
MNSTSYQSSAKIKVLKVLAYGPRFNRRKTEYEWYGVWSEALNDALAGPSEANFAIILQISLWLRKDDTEEYLDQSQTVPGFSVDARPDFGLLHVWTGPQLSPAIDSLTHPLEILNFHLQHSHLFEINADNLDVHRCLAGIVEIKKAPEGAEVMAAISQAGNAPLYWTTLFQSAWNKLIYYVNLYFQTDEYDMSAIPKHSSIMLIAAVGPWWCSREVTEADVPRVFMEDELEEVDERSRQQRAIDEADNERRWRAWEDFPMHMLKLRESQGLSSNILIFDGPTSSNPV